MLNIKGHSENTAAAEAAEKMFQCPKCQAGVGGNGLCRGFQAGPLGLSWDYLSVGFRV